MNIALFALAALMIVGGIVSVIQGFPFVRLESGLAMTIAGATTASAGAVLLGLAAVLRRLGGLERAWSSAGAPRPEGEAASPELQPAAGARQRPSLAATAASLGGLAGAGLAGGSLAGAGTAARAGREPSFFDPAPPEPVEPPAGESSPAEPLLPNLLPEDAASAPKAIPPSEPVFVLEDTHPAEDDLLFAALEDHGRDGPRADVAPPAGLPPAPTPVEAPPTIEPAPIPPVPAAIETAAVTKPPSEPVPEPPPVEEAPAVEAEPQVVGTYASGGNTYVMYSTGVIEADTPRGRYTFASLDELKAFVEAGGESDARGAA